MNGWMAAEDSTDDNPWLVGATPRVRRERRRTLNRRHKSTGNGAWVAPTPITPEMIARAAAACR